MTYGVQLVSALHVSDVGNALRSQGKVALKILRSTFVQCKECLRILPLSQYDNLVRAQIEKDGRRWQKTHTCIVCRTPSSGCIGCGKYPTEPSRGGINLAEYIYPDCLQCGVCEKVLPLSQYDQRVHEQIKKNRHQQKKHPCIACRPKKTCKQCDEKLPYEQYERRDNRISQRCRLCEFPYCSRCGQQATEVVPSKPKNEGRTWYRKDENSFGHFLTRLMFIDLI